jgi:AraC-like DNA-binding protein
VPSPYWQLNDQDWLRTEYLAHRRTAADIATEVGCPHKTVDRALRRHDIRRPPHRTLADVPADWLHEQYVSRRRSITDIAGKAGLSRTSVRRALVEAGIPIDDGRLPPELDDPEWLAAQHGTTNRELARRLDVTPEAVSRARQRNGLLAGVRRSSKYPELDDRDWLEKRYHDHGMTQAQIAAEVGCSRAAVALAMDRLGIEARPNKTPQYPELHDRDWLAQQLASGETPATIAEQLGCHRTSVSAALRDHGVR